MQRVAKVFFLTVLLFPIVTEAVPAPPQTIMSVHEKQQSCREITHSLTLKTTDATASGDVTVLQKILIRKGHLTGEPTGYFGKLTESAVRRLQAEYGLLQTGTVGPLTRASIKNKECKISQLAVPQGVSAILDIVLPKDPYSNTAVVKGSITVPNTYKGKALFFSGKNIVDPIFRKGPDLFVEEWTIPYDGSNVLPREYDVYLVLTDDTAAGDFADYTVMKDPYHSKNTIVAQKTIRISQRNNATAPFPVGDNVYVRKVDSALIMGNIRNSKGLIGVTILSLDGSIIYESKQVSVTGELWSVPVPLLPKGIYTVEIYNTDGSVIAVRKITID